MPSVVLCFSLRGLVSGLTPVLSAGSFSLHPYRSWLDPVVPSVDRCSRARGRGKMWVRLEVASCCPGSCGLTSFSSSPPLFPLRGKLLGTLTVDGHARLSAAGVSQAPRIALWHFRGTFLQRSHGSSLSFSRRLWQILYLTGVWMMTGW